MPLWGFSNGTKKKRRKEEKKKRKKRGEKYQKKVATTFAAAKPPAQRPLGPKMLRIPTEFLPCWTPFAVPEKAL